MSDFVELSSPYGSSHYGPSNQPYLRQSIQSIGSLKRKPPVSQYKQIAIPLDEDNNGAFPSQTQQLARTDTVLGTGRVGKVGIDLAVEFLVCAFALLVSVPFLWLAVTMAKYDGMEVTSSDSDYIKQATSTASTLFTILFAAVLGTTLKRFATYRLERGIKLGLLEQVMQSRTFFAAITTQLSFRPVNITALVLLLSWTFSPLGSQASLRLVSVGSLNDLGTIQISYIDTITNQVFDSVSGVDSLLSALKPSYISSVIAPTTTKNGTVDLFGNVKVPWLLSDAATSDNGWIRFAEANLTEESYSSLVGVPVVNLETGWNYSFVIETTYMGLDCGSPKSETLVNINNNSSMPVVNGTFSGPNTTTDSLGSGIYPYWQVAMNQFVSDAYFYGYPEELVNSTDTEIPRATFLFQTRGPWVARCAINQIYVESNVSCQAASNTQIPACAVQAQRKSPNKHAPSTVTLLSFPTTFNYIAQQWILATGPLLDSGYSSLSEYYLQNTSTSFILSGNDRDYADYSNVTAKQFSQRLGQLLNTWVLAGLTSADAMQFPDLNYQNATATYRGGTNVYVVSWAWLGVYCAAIAVMLTSALCSIWCVFHTTVPDVLGYCSSLTRDSSFFDFAKGGSTFDGAARARMLQNVEVRLGEVVSPRDGMEDPSRTGFVNDFNSGQDDRTPYLAIAPPEYLRPPRRGQVYA